MTAQGIVEGAYRLIGQLSPGYSANASDLAAGLEALNQLLQGWNAEGVMIYSMSEDALSLVGATTYAWSSGGAITSANPRKIQRVRTEKNGMSFPAEIVTVDKWDAIRDRSATGSYVEKVYYDYGYPTGQLYLWPPSESGSLFIHSLKPVSSFSVLGDTVNLPAGYELALRYNLAVAVAPEMRRQVEASVVQRAVEAKVAMAALTAGLLGLEVSPAVTGAKQQ